MQFFKVIVFLILISPLSIFAQQDNIKLQEMYNADQSSRKLDKIDWSILNKEDEERREKVFEMIERGGIVTAKDYYNSAMIFQHGNDTIASSMAVKHMKKAVELDPTIDKWLLAAAIDRDLMRKGEPQIFGTQFIKNSESNGKFIRYKIDTTKVSDEERIKYNVETLKQQKIKEQFINANSLANLIEGKSIKEVVELIKAEYKKGQESSYNIDVTELTLYASNLLNNNMIDEACGIIKLCIELYPNESFPYTMYGIILLKQSEKEEAIKNFKKALELNPNDNDTRALLNQIN
ncbi:tetratricopeptide repeat protein [Myroides sp. LJL110]